MTVADGPLAELRTLPWYSEPLKEPRPFLVPAEGNKVIEILPAEKENRRISFKNEILVTEIEDRFFHYGDEMEEEEEEAYEIEIVEDDGDADFYLEIVDGEVFYVFETEDDMSEDGSLELDSDAESDAGSSFEESMHSGHSSFSDYDLQDLQTPDLDEGDDSGAFDGQDYPGEINVNQQRSKGDDKQNDFGLEFEDDGAQDKIEIPASTKKDMDRHSAQKEVRRKKRDAKNQSEPAPKSSADSVASSSDSSSSSSSSSTSSSTPSKIPTRPPRAPAAESKNVQSSRADTRKDASKTTTVRKESSSPPPSPGSIQLGTPPSSPDRGTSMNGSGSAFSPTSRSRSILKANAPSPRAETKKVMNKKESTKTKKQQTFTKTYVRAEQFDGEHRVYSWQKPDWAHADLAESEMAQKGKQADVGNVGKGKNQDVPISPTTGKPLEVDKEEILRRFVSGEIGSGLMSTSAGRQRKLKLSVNGAKLREGGDIVKPITKATVIRTPNDINHLANPGVLRPTPQTQKQQYEWAKPEWLKNRPLKKTPQGAKVKGGADLQTPITQRIIADAEAATKANRKLQKGDIDSSSHHSWKQANGMNKLPDSSEHSIQNASSKGGQDSEAERQRKRQELLARVAKSW